MLQVEQEHLLGVVGVELGVLQQAIFVLWGQAGLVGAGLGQVVVVLEQLGGQVAGLGVAEIDLGQGSLRVLVED